MFPFLLKLLVFYFLLLNTWGNSQWRAEALLTKLYRRINVVPSWKGYAVEDLLDEREGEVFVSGPVDR